MANRIGRGVEELLDPLRLEEGAAAGVGGDLRRAVEEADRPGAGDRAGGRGSVDHPLVVQGGRHRRHRVPEVVRVGDPRKVRRPGDEDVRGRPDRVGNVGLGETERRVRVHGDRPDLEVIVVSDRLVERDRPVEPRRLVRHLVVDRGGSEVGPRARGDQPAVDDVDVPAELVVRGAVDRVAEGEPEVEGGLPVKGVHRLDRRVEDLGRVGHDRRVDGGVAAREGRVLLLEVDELVRRFLVGDVDVGDGEEARELLDPGERAGDVVGRHQVGARDNREPLGAVRPVAVRRIEAAVVLDLVELGLVEAGGRAGAGRLHRDGEPEHPGGRLHDGGVDRVGRGRARAAAALAADGRRRHADERDDCNEALRRMVVVSQGVSAGGARLGAWQGARTSCIGDARLQRSKQPSFLDPGESREPAHGPWVPDAPPPGPGRVALRRAQG